MIPWIFTPLRRLNAFSKAFSEDDGKCPGYQSDCSEGPNIQHRFPFGELPSSVSKIVPKSLPTVESTIYSRVEMALSPKI